MNEIKFNKPNPVLIPSVEMLTGSGDHGIQIKKIGPIFKCRQMNSGDKAWINNINGGAIHVNRRELIQFAYNLIELANYED